MNDIIDNLQNIDIEYEEINDMGSDWHSYLQSRISNLLFKYYENQYISMTELSLNIEHAYIQLNGKESFIVKPDIAIYSVEDKPKRHINHLTVSKNPMCAIEILSPRQAFSELFDKVICYLKNNVQSCWIVLPEAEIILVYNHSIDNQKTYTINDKLIDEILEIELSVAELFD